MIMWMGKLGKKTIDEYLEEGEMLLTRTPRSDQWDDESKISELREEIQDFAFALRKRWMRKIFNRLKSENRAAVEQLYNKLTNAEIALARQIGQLQRDKKIAEKSEKVAVPEPSTTKTERDYSGWANWPTRLSAKMKAKSRAARLPV